MNLNDAFPSNFLKADDVPASGVTVVISKVEREEIGMNEDKETKLVLSFQDTPKKLITNSTNAKTIAKLHGAKDIDTAWIGKPIHLIKREVDFKGETTLAIRVSLLGAQPAAAPASA